MFNQIRKRQPLIHCMTNYVAAPLQANGLLAIGAAPIMADEEIEIEEIVRRSDALLINIGTLNERTKEAMLKAGMTANINRIPIVLDPVGVGASTFRKESVQELLSRVDFTLIRCNAGELATIACVDWIQKGVEGGSGVMDIEKESKKVANLYNCFVIVSGEKDIVTDGKKCSTVDGGHINMTQITGTGCLLSAICTAALTIKEVNLVHLQELLYEYKLVGSLASRQNHYIGDYQTAILNELNRLSRELT